MEKERGEIEREKELEDLIRMKMQKVRKYYHSVLVHFSKYTKKKKDNKKE